MQEVPLPDFVPAVARQWQLPYHHTRRRVIGHRMLHPGHVAAIVKRRIITDNFIALKEKLIIDLIIFALQILLKRP